MDPDAAARLLELNRQFYQTFGREFSSTRRRIQPGVRRILDRLGGDESILDLGCGNGGLAQELARRGHCGGYTGLDFSLPLLQEAGGLPGEFTCIEADLSAPGWEAAAAARSPAAGFDRILAFAVLHHIPGADLRLGILRKVHALLADGGQFVHSEWQFLKSDRLRSRLQPWEAAGFQPDAVDAGDYLLDWRYGGQGLRYVHHFDEAECLALAAASHFSVQETFYSDGVQGGLGLYQVWRCRQG